MTECVFSFDIRQELIPEYKAWVVENAARLEQNALNGLKYEGTWISKIGSTNLVERRYAVVDFRAFETLVNGTRTEVQQKLIKEERQFMSGGISTKIISRIC